MPRKQNADHTPDEGEGPAFSFVSDPDRPGAMVLRVHGTDQSYVDPADPLHLEFDYVEKIAEALHAWRPPPERIRILHLGGGALTLPRFVAATRPTSAQVVCEPDAALTEAVRRELPLPPRSGIKVRPVDGRAGLAAFAEDSLDAVVLDAFAGGAVPGELVTAEFLADVGRVLDPAGLFVANIADRAPFAWSRRVVAGVLAAFPEVAVGSFASTWRGRRYGNMVVSAGTGLNVPHLVRRSAGSAFPYRWETGRALSTWCSGAKPFTDADTADSTPPADGLTWLQGG